MGETMETMEGVLWKWLTKSVIFHEFCEWNDGRSFILICNFFPILLEK
jgi:hypothetical protein